jgi:hypothetical protein
MQMLWNLERIVNMTSILSINSCCPLSNLLIVPSRSHRGNVIISIGVGIILGGLMGGHEYGFPEGAAIGLVVGGVSISTLACIAYAVKKTFRYFLPSSSSVTSHKASEGNV